MCFILLLTLHAVSILHIYLKIRFEFLPSWSEGEGVALVNVQRS